MTADLAFNTAMSFTTNTNWQNYVPEAVVSYFSNMVALASHNWMSAATGIAVAIAVVRGFARHSADGLGNFWVDVTRATLYVLLPISIVLALLLVWQGVPQNFAPYTASDHAGRGGAGHRAGPGGLPGSHQDARHQRGRLLQRQLRPPVREPDARSRTCSRCSRSS